MKYLVLGGGAVKGAHSCGAIKYLLGDLGIKYDGITGISVGALNGAFLAQFKLGEEKQASEALIDLWHRVSTKKIYKRWMPFGGLHALWLKSFYNSRPLHDWVRSELDINKIREAGRNVMVGAVSLSTGEYRTFDQNYINFVDAVLSSSAFPAMMLPIGMEGQLWSDGGIKNICDINSAIDMGATEIDVLLCSPEKNTNVLPSKPTAVSVFKRTIDLMSDEISSGDLYKVIYYNKLISEGFTAPGKKLIKLNIIRPKYDLIDDALDFNQDKIKKMIDIGYNDAKEQYIP